MRTQRLSPDKYRVYRKKAQEFARAMEEAAKAGAWNAAGLNAVHAVISAMDAVTTQRLGERARADDHAEAAELLRRVPVEGAGDHADKARSVLRMKNLVEYEARDVTRSEAELLLKRARRMLAWAWAALPP